MTDERFIKLLGKSIADNRKQRNLSQLDLCSEIGMEKTNLSAIENGRKNISSTTLRRIADGLKCDIGDLFKFYSKD
ncbi:MAG: helix-turn-helix transcriptional regulator [Flavobacteriales bacterium]|nr:helix-turn-helix transcriptional regulator [Flavobacteriales bacterium]